jgi:hypothetical protein
VTTPRIRVEFRDFWPGFDPEDNFLVHALSQVAEVEVGPDANLCIYSCFGTSHRSFAGCKLQVIGENTRPSFYWSDFSIGFDRIIDDRFLRYPFWAWDVDTSKLLRPFGENRISESSKFCAFVVSNPVAPIRNGLFQELSRHRFVHSPGKVFNNCEPLESRGSRNGIQAKNEFLSDFQFTIAAENSTYPGYTTEKPVDAFLAGSIPIYWGDPTIDCDFNPGSFVNFHRYGTITSTVDAVLALAEDSQAIDRMLSTPPMDAATRNRVGHPDLLTEFLAGVARGAAAPRSRSWTARAVKGRTLNLRDAAKRTLVRRIP